MNLRFLQLGLGSMGKRRIRNLHKNGYKNIIGFDVQPERMKEVKEKYGITTVDKINTLSPNDFDVVIISTSPEAHGDYIRFAIANKKHFFVEHPTNDDGYQEIFQNQDSGLVMVPSATFRFYRPVKMLKKILEENKIGRILAFQYHMGQYLPDWHPWEDYRDVYFSKKETSACREMLPFELIWLNWLMDSKVSKIQGDIHKLSDLDMEAEDTILANVTYENGVMGNLLIDVISRKPFRTLRILGSEGVLEWEKLENTIKIYDSKTKNSQVILVPKGHTEPGYINEENQYDDEIKAFVDTILGKGSYPFSFQENFLNLKMLFEIIKS